MADRHGYQQWCQEQAEDSGADARAAIRTSSAWPFAHHFARRAAHFGRLALGQSGEQDYRVALTELQDEIQKALDSGDYERFEVKRRDLKMWADRLSRLLVEQDSTP